MGVVRDKSRIDLHSGRRPVDVLSSERRRAAATSES